MILAAALGQESLSPRRSVNNALKIGGIFLAASGAIYLLNIPREDSLPADGSHTSTLSNANSLMGGLVLLLQASSFSSSLFFQRRLLRRGYDPLTITTWSFATGAACFTVAAVGALGVGDVMSSGLLLANLNSPMPWLGLAYAVFICSVLNYTLVCQCNRVLGALTVTAFVPLQPGT